MAEERTMSTIGRINTKDRSGRQDAATCVAQTQIRQFYRRTEQETKKRSTASGPEMKWRSVKTLFETDALEPAPASRESESEAADASTSSRTDPAFQTSNAETEDGLLRVTEPLGASPPIRSINDVSFDTESMFGDSMDHAAPYFRDLLSDKAVPGADSVRSLAGILE
jgi:hypothetical protein